MSREFSEKEMSRRCVWEEILCGQFFMKKRIGKCLGGLSRVGVPATQINTDTHAQTEREIAFD